MWHAHLPHHHRVNVGDEHCRCFSRAFPYLLATASYKGYIIFVLKTKEYGELCRITSQLLTDGRWVEDTKAVLVDDKRVPCNVRLERE